MGVKMGPVRCISLHLFILSFSFPSISVFSYRMLSKEPMEMIPLLVALRKNTPETCSCHAGLIIKEKKKEKQTPLSI